MSDEAKTERVMKHYEGIITTHPLYPICKLGGYAVDSTTFNEDNPLYAFAFHAVRFDDIEKETARELHESRQLPWYMTGHYCDEDVASTQYTELFSEALWLPVLEDYFALGLHDVLDDIFFLGRDFAHGPMCFHIDDSWRCTATTSHFTVADEMDNYVGEYVIFFELDASKYDYKDWYFHIAVYKINDDKVEYWQQSDPDLDYMFSPVVDIDEVASIVAELELRDSDITDVFYEYDLLEGAAGIEKCMKRLNDQLWTGELTNEADDEPAF